MKGLDVRIGQQVVQWGVGDQFNPTNNLNSDDLRDPLLFGKQAGNFMIRADWYITDDLSWSAVLQCRSSGRRSCRFRPRSGRRICRACRSSTRSSVHASLRSKVPRKSTLLQHPTVLGNLKIIEPDPTINNMQAMFRMAWTIAEQDFALSYYEGRTKYPVPVAEHTSTDNSFSGCDPIQPGRCAIGLIKTDVTLEYPKMHVYGFNVTGEFNPFKKIDEKINGIGYRFEGALVVPDETKLVITQSALDLPIPQPAGEYDYANDGNPAAHRPIVVPDTPFLKWTLGLDYTFGSHLYVNLQWVHGFADEFGAGDWMAPNAGRDVRETGVRSPTPGSGLDALISAATCALLKDGTKCEYEISRPKIGDYIVLGGDVHFLEDAALLRLFMVFEMSGYQMTEWNDNAQARVTTSYPFYTPNGFSSVIYPEFDYNFGNGFQMGAGLLLLLGKTYTKFGDPAAGGSLAFLRASYAL